MRIKRRLLSLALALIITSVYHPSLHGHPMANQQPYDHHHALTAAHRTLPLGSRITLQYRHRTITVTITDRTAPGYSDRLDLSGAAWDRLTAGAPSGLINTRIIRVEYPKRK